MTRGPARKRLASLLLRLSLLSLLALAGCGKEIGRLPFTDEATLATSLPLAAGKVAFWTDLSISYEGPAALTYEIELEQAGHGVASVACEALGQHDVKVGWVETAIGSSHTLRGSGRMLCSAQLPKGGLTSVRATLAFTTRPRVLSLAKADLVIKQ